MKQVWSPQDVEIVIARYQEDLSWIRNLPKGVAVTVYNKGDPLSLVSQAQCIPRPNQGVEAETYLWHILNRYDSLAPWTIFCQGHPFDHAHDFHKVVRAWVQEGRAVGPFHWLGFVIDSDDKRGHRLFVPWSKNKDRRELDLESFYQKLFAIPPPQWTQFYCGAQFGVAADLIRNKPLDWYQRARQIALEFPDAGHCFERTWDQVFGVVGVDPSLLNGELTRYLKPIRRLQKESES